MKKLFTVIAILLLLVSCSTDTLEWMYGLTSSAKENVLFHGDLEKLSSGVLTFAESSPVEYDRTFATVSIETEAGVDGAIISGFSADESAFLSALIIASQNSSKCSAIQEKLSTAVPEGELLDACQNSMTFYNSLLEEMIAYFDAVDSNETAKVVSRILSLFMIDEEDIEFTYREVVGFKVLNSLVTSFLSYPEYAGRSFTPGDLAREILFFEYTDSEDLSTYIGSVTGSLAEARNIVRTIGNGPVLSASDVAAVLDILLEEI